MDILFHVEKALSFKTFRSILWLFIALVNRGYAMFTHVSHLTLFVSNQDNSLDFYMKLGLRIHTDTMFGPMRWLTLCFDQNPHFELVLMQAETPEEKALVGKQGALKPLFTLATTNCLEDCNSLENKGIKFVSPVETQSWGVAAMCQDPDGNLVYLCQEYQH